MLWELGEKGAQHLTSPHVESAMLAPIAPREAPSVEVARRLLDFVLSGRIRPGERLPSERQLAGQLAVGRSAVRDALRPLLLLGIVEARQGDGTYLCQPESSLLPRAVEWGLLLGDKTTLHLVEARTYIEVALAELAASRRTSSDLARMEEHLRAMATPSVRRPAFAEADIAFHLAVAQASGNTVLLGTLASIRSLLRVWMERVLAASADTRLSYREHVPIFDAIVAADPAAAAEAMRAHMRSAQQRLVQALEAERTRSARAATSETDRRRSEDRGGSKALKRRAKRAPVAPRRDRRAAGHARKDARRSG